MSRPLPSAARLALTVVVVVVVVAAGCAARTPGSGLADRFVSGADGPGGVAWPMAQSPEGVAATAPTGTEPVAGTAGSVPAVRPLREVREAESLEAFDRRLQATLAAIEATPTIEARLEAAVEYQRLGVFDRAHRLLSDALAAAPHDVRTLDALARLWRDWGVPAQGLGDAYRAVAADPDSAAAQNTLATILFQLGHAEAADARFNEVLRLDGRAVWARSNLCYAALARGDDARALAECRAALEIDPTDVAARNNLALVHAAAGRWDQADREFLAAAAGDAAVARYNLGMALLSSRDYTRAAEAFEAAAGLRPDLTPAYQRAREARRLAAAEMPPEGGK